MSAYISYEQWIASYAVCVLTPVACGIVLAVVLKHLNGILNRITAKRSAINEALERALATVCVLLHAGLLVGCIASPHDTLTHHTLRRSWAQLKQCGNPCPIRSDTAARMPVKYQFSLLWCWALHRASR